MSEANRCEAEALVLLDYNAARPPEGGPAEVGGLTASSVPLLDYVRASGHARRILRAPRTAEGALLIQDDSYVTL